MRRSLFYEVVLVSFLVMQSPFWGRERRLLNLVYMLELLHNITNLSFIIFLKRLASRERDLLTPRRDVCLADLDK